VSRYLIDNSVRHYYYHYDCDCDRITAAYPPGHEGGGAVATANPTAMRARKEAVADAGGRAAQPKSLLA
jgi:hypothetical protein